MVRKRKPTRRKAKADEPGLPLPARDKPLPLLEAVIQRIARLLAMGVEVEHAVAASDPPVSIADWRAAILDPRVDELCRRAIAEWEETLVLSSVSRGRGLDILERRKPNTWGLVERTEAHVTHTLVAGVSDEVAQRAAQIARDRKPQLLMPASHNGNGHSRNGNGHH